MPVFVIELSNKSSYGFEKRKSSLNTNTFLVIATFIIIINYTRIQLKKNTNIY